MELLYCYYLLFTLLALLFLRLSTSNKKPNSNLPPGPWKLPILGSIHHLRGALPHHRLRELSKEHGPLMLLKLGEVLTLVASSPEAASEIMKTHDTKFAFRPRSDTIDIISYGGKDLMFSPYGNHWREMRKLCMLEMLNAKRVQSFQWIRDEEVLNLVRSIGKDSRVNFSGEVFNLTNDISLRAIMGQKCGDQSAFLAALAEAVKILGLFNLSDLFPSSEVAKLLSGTVAKMQACHETMDRILDGIIDEHMQRRMAVQGQEEKDILDVLLRIQEKGNLSFPLTMVTIKAVLLDMFAAGSDTSAVLMEWTMSELMRHPEVRKKAQEEVRKVVGEKGRVTEADIAELSYLKSVIKETLRLHPAAPLLAPRECQETCEILGYTIPAKTRVFINGHAIMRDPRYWEDAELFKPERFAGRGGAIDFKGTNFEFVPFGAGRRMCPGMTFGLASAEVALASLLYHYDWELPDAVEPAGLDMTEVFGAVVRRKYPLLLRAVPCIPCPTA